MAKLRRRNLKNGFVYDIDFYFQDKRFILSTRTSNRRIANRILMDIQGKIALGTFNINEYQKKDISLDKYFEEYFHFAESFKKKTTLDHERLIARDFMKYFTPARNIRSLDIQLLDRWKASLLLRVNPTTFNIHRRFLHAAMNVAVKWGYLDVNPMTKLAKMRVEENRSFLNDDELNKIFDLLDQDIADPAKQQFVTYNRMFRYFIVFLLNTGLRRSEAVSLRIKNVDFKKRLIYVEHTKGKKYRAVPLNVKAYEVLQELGEDLFNNLNKESATHKFNDIIKRLKMKGFKLHSLRHTFATKLVSAGADILAVKELLGHQDIRTSMVYAKANTDTLRDAIDLLNN